MEVASVLDEKYEILREIKRGGFGIIYYGRDRLFDKPVAIKAISPELIGEAKYVDIFQAESLAIARLNHHNIVRIYDIKRSDDGQFYLIMEFVDGVDLGRLIRFFRKREEILPFHLSAYLIAEVCAGLDYAHTRRDPETHQPLHIVHQDVSPENIMLNRLGEVKIIDFGLGNLRRRRDANRRRDEVSVQGKIEYIAPEQVNGSTQIDHRIDIFSLGVVLFETLTGKKLFQGQNAASIVETLRSGRWDLAPLRNYNVPEPLCQIVEQAVQHDPAQRYQSSNQMYLDLMNYLANNAPSTDYAEEMSEMVRKVTPGTSQDPDDFEHGSPHGNHRPGADYDQDGAEKVQAETIEPEHVIESEEIDYSIPNDDNISILDEQETTWDDRSSDDLRPDETGWQEETSEQQSSSVSRQDEADTESSGEKRTANQPQDVEFYKILEEEDDEGEVRTIIDVIRLSSRSNRKEILLTLVALIGGFLIFAGIDTFGRWTSVGNAIYNYLFPPAIRLVSFPPNAQVYLDDKPLPKTTPLAIEKIPPGVHKLTLTLPKYDPIIRSINVPPKGQVAIIGEDEPGRNKPFVFRFKTTIEISSIPPGAEVYLNDVKYTQQTPCRVVWEVGDPLHVELEKPGLAKLGGFTLNTISGIESIEDRRLWNFRRIDDQREAYALEGTFAKGINISSVPSLAEIYVDNSPTPVGLTGYSNELVMPVGSHIVKLEKAGFLPKSFTIEIDEQAPTQYHVELARVVRLFAKDATKADENDIGANVVELIYKDGRKRMRSRTPCEVTVLAYPYTAVLTKDGYEDYRLAISANSNVAIARMEPEKVEVRVTITDDKSGQPLQDAQVSYQILSRSGEAVFFGQSDGEGQAVGQIPPGEYRFRVKKFGYRPAVKDLTVSSSRRKRLVFKLSPII